MERREGFGERWRDVRVDSDTDRGRELAGDSSGLQLSQAEATAGADTAVVLQGGAANDRAELVDGAGSDGSGLSNASIAASLLAAGLKRIEGQDSVADRRRLCSHDERGITWSKCTRTRRCQSLRKWLCWICWLCLMACQGGYKSAACCFLHLVPVYVMEHVLSCSRISFFDDESPSGDANSV